MSGRYPNGFHLAARKPEVLVAAKLGQSGRFHRGHRAEKAELIPAHVSRYAHDDACACARPVVTGEVVSFLLGYERPRSAVSASYAAVQGVLRRKFLTAGTTAAVAAPSSVRSFHLRFVAVAAVSLRRAIRCQAVGVPVQDMPSVGVLYGSSFVVFERPVMSVLVRRAFARAPSG